MHTSRLARVDQCLQLLNSAADLSIAHRQLIVAGVYAAVVAPRDEVERWFAWPAQQVIADLIADGSLTVPARGWLTAD